MKLFKKIRTSFFSFLLFACEDLGYNYNLITVSNESDKDIMVMGSTNYPDTLYPLNNDNYLCSRILKGETNYFGSDSYSRKDIFKNPKFQIFIVDLSIYDKTPSDTIRKYNMYEERIEFTKTELEQMKWHVTYKGK